MTQLLEKALAEVSKLPKKDQDAVAKWILLELASERRWDQAFARSHKALSALAKEALVEHKRGRTHLLNPDLL